MVKTSRKDRIVWVDLMITLLVLELMSYFYYGPRSLVLGGVCICFSAAAEFISLRLMHRKFTADDLTCTSDALIIALMMPPVIDLRIAAAASVFAAAAAKNVFGGRRNMIFSPAAAAYVFVLTSWGRKLLLYPEPYTKTGIFDEAEGLVSSASYVYNTTGKVDHTDFELLLGNFTGPSGAVSVLLLAVAAVMLIFRRNISVGAFTGVISGTILFAAITPVAGTRGESVKYSLIMNMVLFAAIYIVADRRIAPKREYFAFFYGLFIGVVSYILVLTKALENAVVIVSVLFTPAALAFKNLEKKIDTADIAENIPASAEESAEAPAGEVSAEEMHDAENLVSGMIAELSADENFSETEVNADE